jgi:hypothetical protein
MGKLDELEAELAEKKAELERRAALEAGKVAVKTAWKGLVAAVSGAADSVLSSAEKELDDARAARGKAPPGGEVLDDEVDDFTASSRALDNVRGSIDSTQPSARDRRLAREARAKAELQAMKAAMGEGRAPAADDADTGVDEPVVEARYEGPGAQRLRERREREEKAQRELEALKAQSTHPEDRPPAKRTL